MNQISISQISKLYLILNATSVGGQKMPVWLERPKLRYVKHVKEKSLFYICCYFVGPVQAATTIMAKWSPRGLPLLTLMDGEFTLQIHTWYFSYCFYRHQFWHWLWEIWKENQHQSACNIKMYIIISIVGGLEGFQWMAFFVLFYSYGVKSSCRS